MRFLAFLALLIFAFPAVAQEAVPTPTREELDFNYPIILWSAGDLYRARAYDPAPPVRMTENGVISGVSLSPQGNLLAYRQASPVGIEALSRLQTAGAIAEFDLPSDIYVMIAATGEARQIVGQPANASLFVEGTPDVASVRSAPVWSPDGQSIAWMELPFGAATAQLYIHNLASSLTAMAGINMPVTRGAAPALHWGAGGIAIEAGELLPGELSFYIYTTDGRLLSTTTAHPGENESVELLAWVDNGGVSLFGILYSSGRWALIDPANGAEVQLGDLPLLVSRADPYQSLTLRFSVTPDVGFFWETLDPQPTTIASGAFPAAPERVTLSPSGRAVAFLGYPNYTAAATWHLGTVEAIPDTGNGAIAVGAIFWGATFWRVGAPQASILPPAPIMPTPLPPTACPGFMPSRLILPGSGYVLSPAGDQQLFAEPAASSAVIGIVPAGANFELINGPTCAENTAWWQVSYNGALGWLMEGMGDTYFLIPPV